MFQVAARLMAWTIVLGLATAASAQTSGLSAGAPDPIHGFPSWFEDANGMVLEIAPFNDPYSIAAPPVFGNAFSEQIGFGEEAFWWSADATLTFKSGKRARLVLAQEAAFIGDASPVDGNQFAFGRIRVRFVAPVAGTYVVTHPYGTLVFTAAKGEDVFYSNDNGDLTPYKNDGRVLRGPIGPTFLVAVDPPPPAGYVGDPAILQKVNGSPTGNNIFRIDGPPGSDLDGRGNSFVQTDLFSVSGKICTDATNKEIR